MHHIYKFSFIYSRSKPLRKFISLSSHFLFAIWSVTCHIIIFIIYDTWQYYYIYIKKLGLSQWINAKVAELILLVSWPVVKTGAQSSHPCKACHGQWTHARLHPTCHHHICITIANEAWRITYSMQASGTGCWNGMVGSLGGKTSGGTVSSDKIQPCMHSVCIL